MNEVAQPDPVGSSHLDEGRQPELQPEQAEPHETLKERAIRYVKELGYLVRLFFGLLLDERVDGRVKLFVASVLAYVFAPIDFIPELFSGLFGMLDDFVLSALAVNVILNWVDPEIVQSHWKGSSNLLHVVQKAMKNTELLVPEKILQKIEGWIGRHAVKVAPAAVTPAPLPEQEEHAQVMESSAQDDSANAGPEASPGARKRRTPRKKS